MGASRALGHLAGHRGSYSSLLRRRVLPVRLPLRARFFPAAVPAVCSDFARPLPGRTNPAQGAHSFVGAAQRFFIFSFSGPNFNPPEGLQYAAVVGIAALFFLTYKLYGNGELTARHLNLIVLFSLFFCLLLIRSALLSSDVYNYVFWVKIFTQYHASPYVFTPLAFSSDPFFAVLPPIWLSQPLVYGPLFLVFYFPLQLLAGSDLATNVLLFKLFFILLAVFFYLKRWRAWVLPALMLAAFFKFAPAILLPIAYLSLVRDYPGFKSKLLFTLRSLVAPLVALCVLFS